ncbi:unnamed protein product [Fraxinus pennsylvanica]|uniref:Myb-like domain-containing protein n=1 Tax=Fraxinus pennsylvanica TaxID=56036 RepID=A0AAD1ZGQ8_9LAMI|nr:unnamed protein product [Fraxinus pennsylvanica]
MERRSRKGDYGLQMKTRGLETICSSMVMAAGAMFPSMLGRPSGRDISSVNYGWSLIAHKLPGRTDNEIKNYWHSYLKKKVAKMGETEGQGKAECMNLHSESSSMKSSLESFEHIEGPLLDSCAQTSNLPRILFAEWLPFDQFVGWDSDSLPPDTYRNALENSGSNSQDVFSHDDLLLNEGTYAGEMQPNLSSYIGDMFQEQFKFEQQKAESGFAELFTGEFNINYDVMYI